MSTGRLIAVVGPSGVGKDSVIDGIVRAAPEIKRVRRTITRPKDSVGEEHDPMTAADFAKALASGAFCVNWSAHGHHYGIPASVLNDVRKGEQCLANFSRSALLTAVEVFPNITLLNLTATVATLAKRLAARGRESETDIALRLERASLPIPSGLDVIDISNDGPLEQTVSTALKALKSEFNTSVS